MPASDIVIKGAREHNLRDVDLVLPRNKLICLTGVSGSGKSSLAFDTLYAEGQRRYIESLSSFARQFLGQMPKPDVDLIAGLSPSISISQKTSGRNPRSTVGTITEIYDYLRVLFARVGDGHCPHCGRRITAQTKEQIVARILQLPQGTKISVLAPLIRGQKGEYRDLFVDLLKQGFVRARVDGDIVSLSDDLNLDRQMRHNIEVVVDRLAVKRDIRPRLAEAVEVALKMGEGNLIVALEDDAVGQASSLPTDAGALDEVGQDKGPLHDEDGPSGNTARGRKGKRGKKGAAGRRDREGDIIMSAAYSCTDCGLSFEPPSPQLFSFNSPQGMCGECDGLGEVYSFDPQLLIPDDTLSFKQGCIELVGPWKEMGRWRRHIYHGVAETIERRRGLADGEMLDTPWKDLDPELQKFWLWGTGDQHITFTWRSGASPMKYGGKYDGIVPEMESKYRGSKSKPQIRQLEKYMNTMPCAACDGERLKPQARAVTVTTASERFREKNSLSLPEVCQLAVGEASEFFRDLVLDDTRAFIAVEVLKEIRGRLGFLINVGLDYLTLDRTAPTLSGGESQRIRLAGQIGSGLVGVLYILDEPSIGLHPRDNDRLLDTLARLRDMGNTVVVVEHDEDTMWAADHLIDFGPGPGVRGGEVVAEGPAEVIARAERSVTGQYLSGKESIATPKQRRAPGDNWLRVRGAAHNNLKNVDVEMPLGTFVCVTGVSGSGKSSLVNDILVEALRRDLNGGEGEPGRHDAIEGLEHLDKLIAIDQSPIGRTPRSNPGTYIKVFDEIRKLFTQLPDAKRRGFLPGRFSFNVSGGRCEACEGNGSTRLEMDFLADVWVTCPVCEGHRFNRETLQVKFKDKSIAEVLEMDVQQALELFENIPKVRHKLQTLHDVGLDYLKIGQPSPTLSGGEAQRIKLARELVKKSTGKTLYLLDEPTTGLHFADIRMLLKVLHDFADAGNTVLVVEHNLDVIKTADWIIDLGPEGGEAGGRIIACGTPEQVAQCEESYTGRALAEVLRPRRKKASTNGKGKSSARSAVAQLSTKITVQGARQHNLKGIDAEILRDQMTVFCGPSGSGKSSLAMDTIYAEGQRRYVESLSSYARQFVSQMQKPALDHIEGLSPAIAIEQKNLGHSPRSTVGTVTEVYDYFRILLARIGTPYCPDCDVEIGTQTPDEITDKVMAEPEGTRLYLMAPIDIEVGRQYESLWDEIRAAGYARIRVNGETYSIDEPPTIDRRRKHAVEVVVDRAIVRGKERSRIAESVENALSLGRGVMNVAYHDDEVPEARWRTVVHSQHLACDGCGRSFEPLSPHNFSFNSSLGWCEACEGLGVQVGANPAALMRDTKLTLAEGAVDLWPSIAKPVSMLMLESLARGTGLPLDVPLEQFNARQRRLIMHGAGEQWFDVAPPDDGKPTKGKKKKPTKKKGKSPEAEPAVAPLFRFQFKGLYPALEEASRLSPSFRAKLEQFVDEVECTTCSGSRLRDDASAVRFRGRTIDDFCRLPLGELCGEIDKWGLSTRERKIAGELVREIQGRVDFLNDVGLEYLTISRGAATLSNGESQRIRLASQLGSGLCGVLYVLDEPTIGLHPRDNTRLLRAIHKLRDLGNTLVVVEHDREVIEHCDAIIDFGPAAGKNGGTIVARGTPAQIAKRRASVTGPYLTGKKAIPIPSNRRFAAWQANGQGNAARVESENRKTAGRKKEGRQKAGAKAAAKPVAVQGVEPNWLEVIGARHNNLRGIDVRIPLGTLTAVTGVSGGGKSSLIDEVLYASLARTLHRAATIPGAHDEIRGIEHINKVIRVDQQPLGNSPTSNPATYTGVFELIRHLFAQLPSSKVRGYTPRRFSFNVAGGRCEACEGNGQICIEMHFLPDVWVQCETCRGRRYDEETLSVLYHGHSIADVLDMTCGEAVRLFRNIPKIRRTLQTLCDVGLDYLTLGQSAPTLSGGEAQRVKLAAELSRPDTGRTLYLLDEPTTGLHFDDLAKLLDVLHRLVDLGNTVVVIEHNLDVIKSADWMIDIGPEAGEGGGRVVACGTPESIVSHAQAYTQSSGAAQNDVSANDVSANDVSTNGESSNGESTNGKRSGSDSKIGSLLRSYSGEALAPVLAAGPYVERSLHDFSTEEEKREGDLDIHEVGASAKMPWEADGRRWHTRDRVGRKGEPCRWDGRILERVVDRIHQLGEFSETDWNSRSVVEISAPRKSDGWFFHAITGEAWLLKMKFRVTRSHFKRQDLTARFDLKTLNELDELPIYGNEPRVKCKNLRGPWQEVEIRAHTLGEIDTPEFWSFLEEAAAGFFKFTDRVAEKPEDIMPWKKLGQKWHLLRKGFPPGQKIRWDVEVLEELIELLSETAPQGQFLWNNQQIVNLMTREQREPWATLHTKRTASVDLTLTGPKGKFTLGRVAGLARDRKFDGARAECDQIRLSFRTLDDVHKGDLAEFLSEHFAALETAKQ
ncbi:MAG: excinuclease ABC subunit UvrA [Pirellulaceae bacterium]